MPYRIFLVEDDLSIGSLIEAVFTGNGSTVKWYKTGMEAMNHFTKGGADICILDFTLPDTDGLHICNHIKSIDPEVPFLFVTANQESQLKYLAFESGCDDFIPKPFQIRELVLRVEAILRRTKSVKSTVTPVNLAIPGDFNFDYNSRIISAEGKTIKLSAKEAHLFKLLLDSFNGIVQRRTLMQEVWGSTDTYTSKCLDVYLSKLRKIIKISTSLEILNEHGVGYKLISMAPVG